MKRILIVMCIVIGLVGCNTKAGGVGERLTVFSVEDFGDTVQAMGYKAAMDKFDYVTMSLIGKLEEGDDGVYMEAANIRVRLELSPDIKEYPRDGNVIADGYIAVKDIECVTPEDREELLSVYAEVEEERTTEVTTWEVESAVEETTTLESLAESKGIDIASLTREDAPIELRIRDKGYECKYECILTEVNNIERAIEYSTPIYEGKAFNQPSFIGDEELREGAIERKLREKEEEEIDEVKAIEAERRERLDKMSISELTAYIRAGGEGGKKEPNPSAYSATPLYYFRLDNGKIRGLTEKGKTLKTVIVPDAVIPDDTELWSDLKAGNNVETLIIQGNHFTAVKVMTPETESEKREREYKEEPAPFTYVYSSDFSIGTAALRGCTSLKVVGLPKGVDTIGNYAFADCTNLEYIKMPSEVFTVGGHILDGCGRLESLIMPARIHEKYNTEALYNIENLKNLVFISNDSPSAGIVDEDMYMFKGCNSLEQVVISNTQQFDKSRLENAYKGLNQISFKFKQKEVQEDSTEGKVR